MRVLARRVVLRTLATAALSWAPARRASGTVRATDEFEVSFTPGGTLGLTLRDLRVATNADATVNREGTSRVVVADVDPGGAAAAEGRISIDDIVVAVNGENVELENVEAVRSKISAAQARGVTLTLKDGTAFNAALVDPPGRAELEVSTALTPSRPGSPAEVRSARRRNSHHATTTSGPPPRQVFRVRRSQVARECKRRAEVGDILEIAYEGRLTCARDPAVVRSRVIGTYRRASFHQGRHHL